MSVDILFRPSHLEVCATSPHTLLPHPQLTHRWLLPSAHAAPSSEGRQIPAIWVADGVSARRLGTFETLCALRRRPGGWQLPAVRRASASVPAAFRALSAGLLTGRALAALNCRPRPSPCGLRGAQKTQIVEKWRSARRGAARGSVHAGDASGPGSSDQTGRRSGGRTPSTRREAGRGPPGRSAAQPCVPR